MTWVLLKKRGGDDIAVNLNHVVSIEPIQRAGQDPAAILTTVQVDDNAKRQRIELETSFRKLVNLVGATAVDPPAT